MKLSKPVLIDGIYYNSINLAAKGLNVDTNTITNRINSKNFQSYSFTKYMPPSEKVCSTCKKIKPLEEFKKAKKNRDGHSSWCKKCWSIYVIINQKKENKKRNNHKWEQSERGRISKKFAKETRRANETSAKVILTNDEKIYIKSLHQKVKIMRKYGFDVHLDHIIPVSKGGLHIPENLEIIPGEDNIRKGNRYVA